MERCGSTRVSARRGPTALTVPARPGQDRLRCLDFRPDGIRSDERRPAASGKGGRRNRVDRGNAHPDGGAAPSIASRSDDLNSTAAPHGAAPVLARESGISWTRFRGPSRTTGSGVHRPRDYIFPPTAPPEALDGHLLLRSRGFRWNTLRSRVHNGMRLDRRAGGRVHPLQRHRLRRGRAARGLAIDELAPRLSFFLTPLQLLREVAKFRAAAALAESRETASGPGDPRLLAPAFSRPTAGRR